MKTIISYLRKIPPYWCLLWLFFYCSFGSLGFPIAKQTFGIFRPNTQPLLQALLTASVFYFLYQSHLRKWFLWLIIPYFLISWLYLPQAIMYGNISVGIINALFETNPTESWEYIQNFPKTVGLIWLLYFLLFVFLLKIQTKRNIAGVLHKGYCVLCLICIIILSIKNPVVNHIRNSDNILKSLSSSSYFPVKFIANTAYYANFYFEEKKLFNKAFSQPTNWHIISSKPKYKNYVLIIGESMRKDYMSLYSYPFDNTPFLNRVNGIIFQNYISTAPNTQASLTRTLYRTDKEGNIIYMDNIITLVRNIKSMKIYWLSNQGMMGQYDTAASRLGTQADRVFFTKKFDYSSQNNSDFELLTQFDNILSESETATRLIVLHLMGQHTLFCERIDGELKLNLINKDMSCYLQSIQQTDELIRQVNQRLQHKGESYSVIYFSDHGLSKNENFKDGMWVNNKYKQNYQIPFIRFDSDSTERTIIHSPKSAFDFINGFAEWLGIEEKTLSQQPSFFEDKPNGKIRVFNWHEMVDFDSLEDDPPLPPTPYK